MNTFLLDSGIILEPGPDRVITLHLEPSPSPDATKHLTRKEALALAAALIHHVGETV